MLSRRRTALGAALACCCLLAAAPQAFAGSNDPFKTLAPGFTQELYATGLPYAGGVAFAPDGDPLVSFFGMFRVDKQSTTTINGSTVHPTTHLDKSSGLCLGITNGFDGRVYANTSGGVGVVDPDTGVLGTPAGDPGCLGMEPDPQTGKLVYSSYGPSGLLSIAPDLASASAPFSNEVSPDGIAFDPTGRYLFTSDQGGLAILGRDGHVIQRVALTNADGNTRCCTDGIAFHASAPKFVVTNNTDGTMTRFDFPNDDYTKTPTQSDFATGGFRGDLTQVGTDGCLYAVQGGTRFADGTENSNGSIVKVCPGFAPPVPIDPVLLANPSLVSVLPGLTLYLKLSASLTNPIDHQGIPGEPIVFKVGNTVVCTAVTDANGVAACNGNLVATLTSVLGLGYTANFAGDGLLKPETSRGPLAAVGPIKVL